MAASADLHLLAGWLARRIGLIHPRQLVAAFQAGTLDKSKSLADEREARGDVARAKRAQPEGWSEVRLLSAGVEEYDDARGDIAR
jgi:hypothetical protein